HAHPPHQVRSKLHRPAEILQICPFVFNHFHDAPPATLFFSCFCIVAGGGYAPAAKTLHKNDSQSKESRKPHDRHPEPRSTSHVRGPRSSRTRRSLYPDGDAATLPQAPRRSFSLSLPLPQRPALRPSGPPR